MHRGLHVEVQGTHLLWFSEGRWELTLHDVYVVVKVLRIQTVQLGIAQAAAATRAVIDSPQEIPPRNNIAAASLLCGLARENVGFG